MKRLSTLALVAASLWAQPEPAKKAPSKPTVVQHMILAEPTGTDLTVNETLIVEGPSGKIAVAIPPDATLEVGVRNEQNQRTPIQPVKRGRGGEYDIPFTATGNETRIDLRWSMTFISPEEFSGRILHGGGPVRFVFPRGVTAKGAALESNGVEPTTQATIYTLKGDSYKIMLDGAGALRSEQPAAQPEEEGPAIEQILPRIYERKYWVVGLTLAILAVGFAVNYRASAKG